MSLTTGRGFALPADPLSQGQVPDMSDRIHLLEDDASNITKILMQLPKFPAGNTIVQFMVDQDLPYSDTLGASADNSSGSVTATDGGIWLIGDVFRVATTNELMRVTSISTNVLTVTRGYAGTTAASAANGAAIVKAGVSHNSGSLMMQSDNVTPIATRIQEVRKTCPTEIFRTAVALSRSEMQTKMYVGADRGYQRLKAMRNHRRMIELSLLYGVAASTEPRMLQGILGYVNAANVNSTTTSFTDVQAMSDLNAGMRYGKREKYCFISRSVAAIVSSWGLPLQRIDAGQDNNPWGVDIVKLITPFGTINFVVTDALIGTVFNKYAVLIDLNECRLRPLQDTILRQDIHPPYADGVMDEYLTETAVEWGHDQKSYLWNAITS